MSRQEQRRADSRQMVFRTYPGRPSAKSERYASKRMRRTAHRAGRVMGYRLPEYAAPSADVLALLNEMDV